MIWRGLFGGDLFGRGPKPSQDNDPRWALLDGKGGTCACCGAPMDTLLSFACDRPDPYPSDKPKFENAQLLAQDGDILTEDFCRMDRHRFVRCIIEFPLKGRDDALTLGVWSSLSIENFDRMIDRFDLGTQGELGQMTSWLSNAIRPGSDLPVAVWLVPEDGRQRPRLHIADEDHALFALQRDGLDFETLADWLAAYGHDIRTAQ